jgi:hypothetical protein
MAQQRVRPAGEYRSHPMAPSCEQFVPDGVDPAVHAMQAVRVRQTLDLIGAIPEVQQVTEGDHPVLIGGARRQRTLARPRRRKPAHIAGTIRLDLHAPIVARTSLQRTHAL